ncbi:hypothetical protein [Methylobacterium haplocladii]|uniref:Uncharacterized protein n=1 Tax=Methylobacterium haplocladii TaxID=1176176 RepID=A0A512IUY4_9HYPH|nr:hypothetical protein [Methylobacterium haplocladii]GEP01514.1 hypothetical protein MHA02_39010 [Methylobacterium haplocladii]GJD82301.1 hypothetical protein HPGCJGGD_0153 [Methylobacterium haplocladii]GLS59165.1 hypothetical protein GCM10007887_18310 [Methylobacterium haplocladii]
MGQHSFEFDAAATTVPSVADDRARHRAYAEAVHFMRRSGREHVEIEAIVALVAYLRKDFEVPSEQLIEDGYWELVARSRKGNDQVDDWLLPSEGGREVDYDLIATLHPAEPPEGEDATGKPPHRKRDDRTLGQVLAEAFNRKKPSEERDCEVPFKPPAPCKAGGQRFGGSELHERDPRTRVAADRQDVQARVVSLRQPTMASRQPSASDLSDRPSYRDVEVWPPGPRTSAQCRIDPSIRPAFEELENEIRRNLQEISNAAR